MIANKSTQTSKTAFIGERQVKASVNNASDSIEVVKHELSLEGHSGPLPCSKEFEAYERVSPGAANRILIMAEQEQMHRHKMEEMLTAAAVSISSILWRCICSCSAIMRIRFAAPGETLS